MSASLNDRPNKVTVSGDAATVVVGGGVQGPQGDPGIVISATEPADTDVLWADTSEAGDAVVPVGGTTGQALVKASDDDYDTTWATPSSGGIPATIIDAKGDLIVGSAADTAARLAVGTDGQQTVANANSATGLIYVQPARSLYGGSSSWHQGLGQSGLATQSASSALTAAWSPIWIPRRVTIDALGTYCATLEVGSTARLGLYASATNATVGSLVADYGTVSGSTIGAKSATGSTVVDPGLYFLCVWTSNHSTVRWARANTVSMIGALFGDSLPGNGRIQFLWRATSVDYSAGLPSSPPTLALGDNFSTSQWPIGFVRFS